MLEKIARNSMWKTMNYNVIQGQFQQQQMDQMESNEIGRATHINCTQAV